MSSPRSPVAKKQAKPKKPKKPSKVSLPADDVRAFRVLLDKALNAKDDQDRAHGSSVWGVYAFYDYEGEPIYVGQTKERLGYRVRRHLTNQRTDAVAMRILDVFEVAEVELWPLWDLLGAPTKGSKTDLQQEAQYRAAQQRLDAAEYSAYLEAIEASKFKAILNEKIPPRSAKAELPPSVRIALIDDKTRQEREHPDIRIARRAETISRLAAVARERGEVSDGLRRVLVIQAIRLTYLSAARLAFVEGRPTPDPSAIDTGRLVGNVLYERDESATPVGEDEIAP